MSPRLAAALAAAALAACIDSHAAGDARRGERVHAARCAACHALAQDRTGPRHCGVFGRRAGSLTGFRYSPAMKRSGLTWEAGTLDRFLADPMRVVPGTTMAYAGVDDARERADLIAWLEEAARSPECTAGG